MRRHFVLVAFVIATAANAGPAAAEIQARVKVTSGDTLGAIARKYACSIEAVQRQNKLRSTKIRAGQTIAVPVCGKLATAKAAAKPVQVAKVARVARVAKVGRVAKVVAPSEPVNVLGQSIGKPWRGKLTQPSRLVAGKGYLIRRPARAYGTRRLVDLTRDAIAAVRADHPRAHRLAVGDLSAKRGGRITEHSSHQSGRDVDVGFFFKRQPKGYPESFVAGDASNLDLAATWDLLVAFARTADDRGGVQAVYLDYDVQGLLYEWAQDRGVSDKYLDRLFQYPDGKHGGSGLVRHEPHHDDHFHVRLQCPPGDAGCQ